MFTGIDYHRLTMAVIRQWKQDGKPKFGERAVKQYAELLAKEVKSPIKLCHCSERIRHILDMIESKEQLI